LPSLPDVPTIKEAGIDNCEVASPYGILAPAGTPKEIVNRLNVEWNRSAAMPDTKELILKNECEPVPPNTPEQFSEFIKAEIVRWAKVIKDANISRID
jgi:tripartite-type tricarboxylate transporter receptor subunit TctC